jgi:hypothetical protein
MSASLMSLIEGWVSVLSRDCHTGDAHCGGRFRRGLQLGMGPYSLQTGINCFPFILVILGGILSRVVRRSLPLKMSRRDFLPLDC